MSLQNQKILWKRDQLSQNQQYLYSRQEEVSSELSVLVQVRDIIVALAKTQRQAIIDMIEALTSQALQMVFQRPDYLFKLQMGNRRNNLVCDPFVVSDFKGKQVTTSVLEGHGGGLWDVISIVLRIVCVLFSNRRRILILDEPFRSVHLTTEQTHQLFQFLSAICRDLKFQLIIVSTDAVLEEYADTVHVLSLTKQGSTVVMRK